MIPRFPWYCTDPDLMTSACPVELEAWRMARQARLDLVKWCGMSDSGTARIAEARRNLEQAFDQLRDAWHRALQMQLDQFVSMEQYR